MRFVSVVVPDCEIAMTSVSRMSAPRPKPDNSVAVMASTVTVPAIAPQDVRQALPRDRGRALSDNEDARDRTVAEPGAHRVGQRFGGKLHVEPAVSLDDLAAQCLAERCGRFQHLFQEVVRRVTAVDVARGDLRRLQFTVDR